MTITKQEFLSEIKLIGGRGYGIFIETDSRRHRVETGDKILEVSSHTVTPSTGSSNISVVRSPFPHKPLFIQLPPPYITISVVATVRLLWELNDGLRVRVI